MKSKQKYSVDNVIQYVFNGESDFELSDDDSDVEPVETVVEPNNSDHDESSDDDVPVQNLVDNNKDVTNHENHWCKRDINHFDTVFQELELEPTLNENCTP